MGVYNLHMSFTTEDIDDLGDMALEHVRDFLFKEVEMFLFLYKRGYKHVFDEPFTREDAQELYFRVRDQERLETQEALVEAIERGDKDAMVRISEGFWPRFR